MVPSCGQQRISRPSRPTQLHNISTLGCTRYPPYTPTRLAVQPASSMSVAADHTDIAADALMHGNGLARKILSDPSIEGDPLAFLKATEAYWKAMKHQKHEPHKKGPTVVTTSNSSFTAHIKQPQSPSNSINPNKNSADTPAPDFDVIMCGGTLGIMVALALQQQGFKVAVVEKRVVQGRVQEWNTSRHECQVLADLGLMTQAELDATIVTEFNPIRCGFKGGDPLWVNDCLNIGVDPKQLIAILRSKFEALGGVIHEHTAFKSAVVCTDGVAVTVAAAAGAPADVGDTNRPNAVQPQQGSADMQQHSNGDGNGSQAVGQQNRQSGGGGIYAKLEGAKKGPQQMSCRLLLDCMGHYSPIVKQLRGRAKPEGMVLVVGGCATGVPVELNKHADLLYSMTDASADMQLFWEAFPAEGGSARTTYMFAYSDANPSRPSFEHLLDTYFRLLPAYQNLPGMESLKFKRVLFGGFPCYGSSPLQPGFDRVIQLGDASASQSPLSFGGFGCMLRHVRRFSESLSHALRDERLSRGDLSWIHAYQPSLAAAWLFQRSMSIGVGQLQQQQKGVAAAAGQYVAPAINQGPAASLQSNIVPVSFLSQMTTKIVHSASGSSNGTPGTPVLSTGISSGGTASSISDTSSSGQPVFKTAFDRSSVEWHHDQGAATTVAGVAAAPASTHGPSFHTSSPSQQEKHISSSKVPSSRSSSGNNGSGTPEWLLRFVSLPRHHVNALLGANFSVMAVLGQRVLKPFLQDTLLLGPLALTMLGMMIVKPLVVSRVLCQVGPKVLFGWFGHFAALIVYTVAYWILSPLRRFTRNYTVHRVLDLLKYGSSSDYTYHASKKVSKNEINRINQAQAAAATKAADGARQRQVVMEVSGQERPGGMIHQRRPRLQDERELSALLAAGMGAAA